jgi:hypothetical protein
MASSFGNQTGIAVERSLSVMAMLCQPIPLNSNTIQQVKKDGYTPWFTVLFLCCANAVSFGQRVTVRVVNLDGTPFSNKQVYVSGLSAQATTMRDEQLKLTKKPIRADLSLTTDGNGETTFDLPQPAPAYIYVRPVFSERVWDCSCLVRIPTDELLQKGYITGSPYDAHKKPKPVIQPEARKLVFVMRRTPLWWQLVYPIEKG